MRRSDPKTSVHSSNGRLDVIMMEPRSNRWLMTSNQLGPGLGERDEAKFINDQHPGLLVIFDFSSNALRLFKRGD